MNSYKFIHPIHIYHTVPDDSDVMSHADGGNTRPAVNFVFLRKVLYSTFTDEEIISTTLYGSTLWKAARDDILVKMPSALIYMTV